MGDPTDRKVWGSYRLAVGLAERDVAVERTNFARYVELLKDEAKCRSEGPLPIQRSAHWSILPEDLPPDVLIEPNWRHLTYCAVFNKLQCPLERLTLVAHTLRRLQLARYCLGRGLVGPHIDERTDWTLDELEAGVGPRGATGRRPRRKVEGSRPSGGWRSAEIVSLYGSGSATRPLGRRRAANRWRQR